MLDESAEGALLTLGVVKAGHDEDGITLACRGLLEAGSDLGVHWVCQVIEQEAEDVRPFGAEAACGRVRDVSQLLSGSMDGGTRRFPDAGVVLEGA
jgi:hypothetical protein